MNGEGQDPQNRKDHMHTLNEWLGQEHSNGYRAGKQECSVISDKRILAENKIQELLTTNYELREVLRQLIILEDDHDAAGTEWADVYRATMAKARRLLAEKAKE